MRNDFDVLEEHHQFLWDDAYDIAICSPPTFYSLLCSSLRMLSVESIILSCPTVSTGRNHAWPNTARDAAGAEASWERKLAKSYYDKLFKEYCLADLSRYRERMMALRWRTEKEVLEGKGSLCNRFSCLVR